MRRGIRAARVTLFMMAAHHHVGHAAGSKPSLRFKGVSGTGYDLNLFNEKEMSGTATLTMGQAGTSSGDRTRQVNLEKKK